MDSIPQLVHSAHRRHLRIALNGGAYGENKSTRYNCGPEEEWIGCWYAGRLLHLAACFALILGTAAIAAEFHRFSGNSQFNFGGDTRITDVSSDGSTVVGHTGPLNSSRAYQWKDGTKTELANPANTIRSMPLAVSLDGSIIVGLADLTGFERYAVRWSNGVPTVLPRPEGATSAVAIWVSEDGNTLGGNCTISESGASYNVPWRWTNGSGVQLLSLPSPSIIDPTAVINSIHNPISSADGAVVHTRIDFAVPLTAETSLTESRQVRWTGTNAPEFLQVPEGYRIENIVSVTQAGAKAFGNLRSETGSNTRVCEWNGLTPNILTAEGSWLNEVTPDGLAMLIRDHRGMILKNAEGETVLSPFNGGRAIIEAHLSDDGAIVAGRQSNLYGDALSLFIWDRFNGTRSLATLVMRNLQNSDIAWMQKVSGGIVRNVNGKITIAGDGTYVRKAYQYDDSFDPTQNSERDSWVITSDAPSGAELNPFAGSLLDKSTKFTPRFALQESVRNTFVSYTWDDPGDDELPARFTDPASIFRSQFRITVSMEGADLQSLNTDTPVQVILGSFILSKKLGDDPKYIAGSTKATFRIDEGGVKGVATCSWNSKAFTIQVNLGLTENPSSDNGVFFSGPRTPSFGVVRKLFEQDDGVEYIPLDLRIGDRSGSRLIRINFNSRVKDVKKAGAEYAMATVVLAGAFDQKGPVVEFIRPSNNAKLFPPFVPVYFRCNDSSEIRSVLFRVNGGPFEEFSATDLNNFGQFFSTSIVPIPGENILEAKAIDILGNESKIAVRKFTYFTKAGQYKSLLTGADSKVRGMAELTLTELGRFSARIVLDGRPFVCAGVLDENGVTTVVLMHRGATLTLALQLETDGVGNHLTGTLSGPDLSLTVDAARFLYDGANTYLTEPLPHHAMVFEPSGEPGTPTLSGCASFTPTASGWVFIEGMLADGTPLYHQARIDGRGSLPLYIPLNKAGFLAGRIDFADVPDVSDFSGALTWRRPPNTKGLFKEGFETVTMALGSKNSPFPPDAFPPSNLEDFNDPNATIVFSGGNLTSEVRKGVRMEFYSADLSSFNLSALYNSLFQVGGSFPSFAGRFTDPLTNKKRKFAGVFFRKQNRTFGIFKGDTEMGTVALEPEVE